MPASPYPSTTERSFSTNRHIRTAGRVSIDHRPASAIGEKLRTIASASIDLSDGLTSDLGHLTRASKVRARVDLSRLPISAGLQRTFEPMRAWRCAATSGDDYELCFTVPRAAEDRLASEAAAFECAVTRIGVIEHGEGVCCMAPDGEAIDLGRGYEHFVPR